VCRERFQCASHHVGPARLDLPPGWASIATPWADFGPVDIYSFSFSRFHIWLNNSQKSIQTSKIHRNCRNPRKRKLNFVAILVGRSTRELDHSVIFTIIFCINFQEAKACLNHLKIHALELCMHHHLVSNCYYKIAHHLLTVQNYSYDLISTFQSLNH
jgi:hypothetical protein